METRHLPMKLTHAEEPLPDSFVASSLEMREIVSVVRAIAPTEITVLLLGESGTGKEVLARLIHDLSRRKSGPFITVNCGAIPEGLIESELFGHEKGAFTGAHAMRKGFFEAANGGTIFLDEIGEMPLQLQVKLLRVLETGSFNRVGSPTSISSDARVIAATNRDLELEVRAGRFRTDLYYRLRAVMLRIPPLRNRREDIPFLIDLMVREFAERHKLATLPQIDSDAIQALIDHEWRGNVRELRNAIEQLVVLSGASHPNSYRRITLQDVSRLFDQESTLWQEPMRNLPVAPLPKAISQDQSERELIYRALIELRNDLNEIKALLKQPNVPIYSPPLLEPGSVSLSPASTSQNDGILTLDERERRAVTEALDRFHGNRRKAAEALGLSERTLYRKLKELGIEHHD